MSCELSLFCFNLSCKHFRSSRSSFCSWRLNHFEFLKIISLSLNLKIVFDSWISGVKFSCWCFPIVWFHHFHITLLISLCVVLKLNCISKIRGLFLDILFRFWLCSCVLIGWEIKLLIESWKCIVVCFCYWLMPWLFLLQFISFQCVDIKSIRDSFCSRVWFWRNYVWWGCFGVSICFSS